MSTTLSTTLVFIGLIAGTAAVLLVGMKTGRNWWGEAGLWSANMVRNLNYRPITGFNMRGQFGNWWRSGGIRGMMSRLG